MMETDEMRDCPKCGKSIKAIATRCVWCFEKSEPVRKAVQRTDSHSNVSLSPGAKMDTGTAGSQREAAPEANRNSQPPTASRYATSVERRYRDAYAVAGEIVQQGQRMKVIAVIAAAILALLTMVAAMQAGGMATGVLVAGALLAAGAYGVIHSYGVRIAAQGQHLLASLDVAVHTSPFLDDRGKAQAMSLS